MVWTSDESQTGLIKTKNCFTKISFITKLDIYIWSCSILAQLLTIMHILKKKKNFLLQHKNRNTQKIIQSFSTTFHIQSDLNLV